jgi:hypothetical protein
MEHKKIGADMARGDEINIEHALFSQKTFAGDIEGTEKSFETFKDLGLSDKEYTKEIDALEADKSIDALLKKFNCTAEDLQKRIFERKERVRSAIRELKDALISHDDEKKHNEAQEKYFSLSQEAKNIDNLLNKISDYIMAKKYESIDASDEKTKPSIDPDIYGIPFGKN